MHPDAVAFFNIFSIVHAVEAYARHASCALAQPRSPSSCPRSCYPRPLTSGNPGLSSVYLVNLALFFAQPESEFESEGTAELLGVETATKGGEVSGGGQGTHQYGQSQQNLDGGAAEGGRGGDGGIGGSVSVVLHTGSYCVPAEAFLGSPKQATATWGGFQSVWSGLPYAVAFPVESPSHSRQSRSVAGAADGDDAVMLRTATSIRLAMMSPSSAGDSGSRGGDSRAAAAVACPAGNTDYAVSTAWAFEAWDGTPVLCALTAMKAPLCVLPAAFGGGGGGVGDGDGQPSWHGRLEVRCGSHACSEFAQCNPARFARFVTNGVFAPPMATHQQQQQQDPFGGAFLPATPATTSSAGGGGGFGGPHPDWFSRTDTASTPSSPAQGEGVVASAVGKITPLVHALWGQQHVDTMQIGGGAAS